MKKLVNKPWGSEEIFALTDEYAGKIIKINPDQRLSLQHHEEKTETIRVIEGELFVDYGDTIDEAKENELHLTVGMSLHIPKGKIHRFSAKMFAVTLVEVSTTELDDVIRHEDDYGR